ncbi:Protein pelota [Morella rubra]|uniref:Protein pelota n=1 Tax=Morella rubra TaxID=262757 RepID=A0A6A1V8X8_9ROSI|nr:Protein pelota [Morella rubra]
MKIVRKDLVPDGPGSVKMVPVDSDDLWYAYNLIAPGDSVMAVTVRKVLREVASGGRDAERVKLKLEIKVEEIADYDTLGSVLRIRGKNILENEYVKIGAFHTLELELHRPFVLRKDVWDALALDGLHRASDPSASADLAVVLMQEGLAHVFLVGKRGGGSCLFPEFFLAFLKYVDFSVVRCAVIASPGFTKDQFHRHLLLEAERRQLRPIIENKSRMVLVHATSGYKHSLREVLDAPNVMNMIKDTKAAQEVRALKDFFNMLSNVRMPWGGRCDQDTDLLGLVEMLHPLSGVQFVSPVDPARACYGPKHVEVAHERLAIQTLLLTDELFRNANTAARQKYVNLVKSVKDSGGTVHIFSSLHVSGEPRAEAATGVWAFNGVPCGVDLVIRSIGQLMIRQLVS